MLEKNHRYFDLPGMKKTKRKTHKGGTQEEVFQYPEDMESTDQNPMIRHLKDLNEEESIDAPKSAAKKKKMGEKDMDEENIGKENMKRLSSMEGVSVTPYNFFPTAETSTSHSKGIGGSSTMSQFW
jgi:hypothetical protein